MAGTDELGKCVMGLHGSRASEHPIRRPCLIWRHQDLFLMLVRTGLARIKLSDIVINKVDSSGDRWRGRHMGAVQGGPGLLLMGDCRGNG